ncbi:MAG: hypothetical protein Q8Q49_00125 [bacterium]|nr:hypothetical protein [bacterium]
MRHKIGVFGSAEENLEKVVSKAHELGEELGKRNVIVITGASSGLPYEAALRAKRNGAEVWGFSPGATIKKQKEYLPTVDTAIFDKLMYIPQRYEFIDNRLVCLKYRNVTSTANCDAGIIISGRWGTMNEFTNLFDMGKIIGVLTGTGGIADELKTMMKRITKPSKAKVFFDRDPSRLVNTLLNELGT